MIFLKGNRFILYLILFVFACCNSKNERVVTRGRTPKEIELTTLSDKKVFIIKDSVKAKGFANFMNKNSHEEMAKFCVNGRLVFKYSDCNDTFRVSNCGTAFKSSKATYVISENLYRQFKKYVSQE